MSAMAIDPIFIALGDVAGVRGAGGESIADGRRPRAARRRSARSPRVDYDASATLKSRALRAAFERFRRREWRHAIGAGRCSFESFIERERLVARRLRAVPRAAPASTADATGSTGTTALRDRQPDALRRRARRGSNGEILYHAWLQWLADEQWQRARARGRAGCASSAIFLSWSAATAPTSGRGSRSSGSTPRSARRPTRSPRPARTGGFPPYRWDVIAAGGYEWLRQRARRCAELYDGFRVDHLVGFFRTYVPRARRRAAFVPPDEPSQIAQGERLLRRPRRIGARSSPRISAACRTSCASRWRASRVPGYKVLRWEREWDVEGKPFRDPASYPPSRWPPPAPTTPRRWPDGGTRRPGRAARGGRMAGASRGRLRSRAPPFDDRLRDALLRTLFAAGSNLVVVPVQDIFGWRDRINTPAVVDDINWRGGCRGRSDELAAEPMPRGARGLHSRALNRLRALPAIRFLAMSDTAFRCRARAARSSRARDRPVAFRSRDRLSVLAGARASSSTSIR